MSAALPAVTLLIGMALVVRTLAEGGGVTAFGLLVGVLLMLAGGMRLWLAHQGRDRG